MRSFTFVSTRSVTETQSCFITKVEWTSETWMLRWDMMETGKGWGDVWKGGEGIEMDCDGGGS